MTSALLDRGTTAGEERSTTGHRTILGLLRLAGIDVALPLAVLLVAPPAAARLVLLVALLVQRTQRLCSRRTLAVNAVVSWALAGVGLGSHRVGFVGG